MSFRRIKILFFHRTLRQSGAARQIYLLYKSLDRTMFDPFFVVQTMNRVYFKDAQASDRLYALSKSELNLPSAIREYSRIIAHEKPDIIQSFNTDGNLLSYLATRNSPVPCHIASLRNTNKGWVEKLIERRISHAYNKVIVNSKATRDELISDVNMNSDDIDIIHNGIDTEYFRPVSLEARTTLRQQLNIPEQTFVIISVGRIAPQKNHECTLAALAKLKKRLGPESPILWLCLGLVENRRYFNKLKKLIHKYQITENCRFIESVPDIASYYGLANVSVLSSHWEGMPNALLESMSCERLAIVADSADNDGIVENGSNSISFEANNADQLYDALLTARNMGNKTRRRIEQQARQDIINRYNIAAMVRQYQDLYQRFARV